MSDDKPSDIDKIHEEIKLTPAVHHVSDHDGAVAAEVIALGLRANADDPTLGEIEKVSVKAKLWLKENCLEDINGLSDFLTELLHSHSAEVVAATLAAHKHAREAAVQQRDHEWSVAFTADPAVITPGAVLDIVEDRIREAVKKRDEEWWYRITLSCPDVLPEPIAVREWLVKSIDAQVVRHEAECEWRTRFERLTVFMAEKEEAVKAATEDAVQAMEALRKDLCVWQEKWADENQAREAAERDRVFKGLWSGLMMLHAKVEKQRDDAIREKLKIGERYLQERQAREKAEKKARAWKEAASEHRKASKGWSEFAAEKEQAWQKAEKEREENLTLANKVAVGITHSPVCTSWVRCVRCERDEQHQMYEHTHRLLCNVRKERDQLKAEVERLKTPRTFPIQANAFERPRPAPHPLSIPWSVAELAYSEYAKRHGSDQSLERLAQRGGFGAGEMDTLLPGWREMVSEAAALRKRVEGLEAELATYRSNDAGIPQHEEDRQALRKRVEELEEMLGADGWSDASEAALKQRMEQARQEGRDESAKRIAELDKLLYAEDAGSFEERARPLLEQARREGAEGMRERAVGKAKDMMGEAHRQHVAMADGSKDDAGHFQWLRGRCQSSADLADEIRTLPVVPPKAQEEKPKEPGPLGHWFIPGYPGYPGLCAFVIARAVFCGKPEAVSDHLPDSKEDR